MRALLRVLSGQGVPRGRIDGQFEINGRRLRPSQFGARVAHVAFDDPFPWFTVRQHMELTAKFRRPATDNVNVQSMVRTCNSAQETRFTKTAEIAPSISPGGSAAKKKAVQKETGYTKVYFRVFPRSIN